MKIGTNQRRLMNTPVSLGKAVLMTVLLAFAAQAVTAAGFCGSGRCCCAGPSTRTMVVGNHHAPVSGCNGDSPCCGIQTDHRRSNVIPAIETEPHQTKISKSLATVDRAVTFDQGNLATNRRSMPSDRPAGPHLPIYYQTSALLC